MWRFPAERTIKSRSEAFQVETLCYNGHASFSQVALLFTRTYVYIGRSVVLTDRGNRPQSILLHHSPRLIHTPGLDRLIHLHSFTTHTLLPIELAYTLIPIHPRFISDQQDRIRKHNNRHAFLYYLRRRPFFRWNRFGDHLEERYHQERSVRL